jgi:phytoene dehydrogenase-like protein
MRATVVGGEIAGLVASIPSTEAGGRVNLFEAHRLLGARARSSSGAFVTNFGPHALHCDGPWWAWLAERQLLTPVASPPLTPRTFDEACVCGQSERSCGDEYDRSIPLLAAVYTTITERVPSR